MMDFPIPGVEVQSPPPENTYRWATVTAASPLRIRFDGDTTALPTTPSVITGETLSVGNRVWVQLFGRRVIVLGKAH